MVSYQNNYLFKGHKIFKFSIHLITISLIVSSMIYSGCGKELPIEEDLSTDKIKFFDEDSNQVSFPGFAHGKNMVMGFIFTHCPDICPMTTNNMQRIEKKLKENEINNITFVSLTFDPVRDTPSVLKQYAEIRGIDISNWHFLTGSQNSIDSVKKKMKILAIAGDTTYTPDGTPSYFFTHTDRISLIDKSGRVRKNYSGSKIDVDEIVNDIKTLGD